MQALASSGRFAGNVEVLELFQEIFAKVVAKVEPVFKTETSKVPKSQKLKVCEGW